MQRKITAGTGGELPPATVCVQPQSMQAPSSGERPAPGAGAAVTVSGAPPASRSRRGRSTVPAACPALLVGVPVW